MGTIKQIAERNATVDFATIDRNNLRGSANAAAGDRLSEGGWRWMGLPDYALRDGEFTAERRDVVYRSAYMAKTRKLALASFHSPNW